MQKVQSNLLVLDPDTHCLSVGQPDIMDDDERPFKLPKTVQHATSDLMNRIAMFLPQIQQANQRLEELEGQPSLEENHQKIDAWLEPEGLGDDNQADDPSDDDSSAGSEHVYIKEAQREAISAPESADAIQSPGNEQSVSDETSIPSKESAPMIQIHLALGNLDENPAINWIASGNDTEPNNGADGIGDQEKDSECLHDESNSTRQMFLLASDKNTPNKGPLITELK